MYEFELPVCEKTNIVKMQLRYMREMEVGAEERRMEVEGN